MADPSTPRPPLKPPSTPMSMRAFRRVGDPDEWEGILHGADYSISDMSLLCVVPIHEVVFESMQISLPFTHFEVEVLNFLWLHPLKSIPLEGNRYGFVGFHQPIHLFEDFTDILDDFLRRFYWAPTPVFANFTNFGHCATLLFWFLLMLTRRNFVLWMLLRGGLFKNLLMPWSQSLLLIFEIPLVAEKTLQTKYEGSKEVEADEGCFEKACGFQASQACGSCANEPQRVALKPS
ncbi:hypothetical protein TSUD_99710 [Trifolium subterraneum]|uniref:Uncharacterized protein n=1 Tax=Trifolium subterraneum TaxID=3900 RepID=A0A2Z6PV76_TRISU|nr:hypothetical protein TSUD_99710 [Trifolium subterraneum]